jgi:hypothetical protein
MRTVTFPHQRLAKTLQVSLTYQVALQTHTTVYNGYISEYYPSSGFLFETQHFGDWILSQSSGESLLYWSPPSIDKVSYLQTPAPT